MAISVRCPRCGKSYQLQEKLAGRRVRCQCGHSIIVPDLPTDLTNLLDEENLGGATLSDDFAGLGPAASPILARRRKRKISILPIAVTAGIAFAAFLLGMLAVSQFGGDKVDREIAARKSHEPEAYSDTTSPPALPRAEETTSKIKEPPRTSNRSSKRILMGGRNSASATRPASKMVDLSAPPKPLKFKPFGPGYATPEEAFMAYRKACVDSDFATIVDMYTPRTFWNRCLLAVGGLSRIKHNPKAAALLKKHIRKSANPSATINRPLGEMYQVVFDAIVDKRQFTIEALKLISEIQTEKGDANHLCWLKNTRLADVEYRDVRAIVTCEYSFSNGKTGSKRIFFEHIGDRWFLRLMTVEY